MQATKASEAIRAQELLEQLRTAHAESFPLASRPVLDPTPKPALREFQKSHAAAALDGVSVFDRGTRKSQRIRALEAANDAYAAACARQDDSDQADQDSADLWWDGILDNLPSLVLPLLEEAFEDNEAPAAAVSLMDGEVGIVVRALDTDAIPETFPTLTPAGNLTVKKRTKTSSSSIYKEILSGQVLATVKEAFAVAPALKSARVAVIRDDGSDSYGNHRPVCLLAARWSRESLNGITWSGNAGLIMNDTSDELMIKQKGSASVLQPLDLSAHPDLAALLAAVQLRDDGNLEGIEPGQDPDREDAHHSDSELLATGHPTELTQFYQALRKLRTKKTLEAIGFHLSADEPLQGFACALSNTMHGLLAITSERLFFVDDRMEQIVWEVDRGDVLGTGSGSDSLTIRTAHGERRLTAMEGNDHARALDLIGSERGRTDEPEPESEPEPEVLLAPPGPVVASFYDALSSKIGTKKAVRAVEFHLSPDEDLQGFASTRIDGKLGLLTITSRRLFFIDDRTAQILWAVDRYDVLGADKKFMSVTLRTSHGEKQLKSLVGNEQDQTVALILDAPEPEPDRGPEAVPEPEVLLAPPGPVVASLYGALSFKIGTKKAVRAVEFHLSPDEDLQGLAGAQSDGKLGLLTITSRRLFFIDDRTALILWAVDRDNVVGTDKKYATVNIQTSHGEKQLKSLAPGVAGRVIALIGQR